MTSRQPTDPCSEPGVASAENGHVILEGPDGIAITLTAPAAIATGQSLLDAAAEAASQPTPPSGEAPRD